MTRRSNHYIWIPVLVALVLIPQLLFWWLAPAHAMARMVVYVGGTVLTAAIPILAFLTYHRKNIRETAGLFVVSGVLDLAVIALSAALLAFNVSFRSGVFAFVIMALVCLVILVPLIGSVVKEQYQGVGPAAISLELTGRVMPAPSVRSTPEGYLQTPNNDQPYVSVPDQSFRNDQRRPPLPPRNR